MIDRSEIYYRSYFGQPEFLDGIGDIYPVLVVEYKRFFELFNKYMLYSLQSLSDMGKVKDTKNINLFNFIICSCYITSEYINRQMVTDKEDNNENVKIDNIKRYGFKLEEVEELLKIVIKKDVRYDSDLNKFIIIGDINGNEINENNFDELREMIMVQNVIYEPLTFKSNLAQKEFEKELKKREKKSQPVDFLSMVILVDMNINGDVNTYSYYKLAACYEILNKKIIGDYIQRIRAQGVDEPLINLGEELNINSNPYNKSKFFKSHKMSTTL